MKIEILTIFPELFSGFVSSSLIEKAQTRGLLEITRTNIRDFADPPHFQVDDSPYGGGAGMVLMAEPLSRATRAAHTRLPEAHVVLLSASGTPFNQSKAKELSTKESLVLVCGRYEGVDQRYIEAHVDEEISIGDYVLMGGEVPAMVVIEATVRLIDAVVGNQESIVHESYATGVLEGPQYTRPPVWEGLSVPDVLTSGNHKKISEWRQAQSHDITKARRPDLLLREKQ